MAKQASTAVSSGQKTQTAREDNGKSKSKEKLHWTKVTLDLTTEELEIYKQIADRFDTPLADYLVNEIRDSSRGLCEPEFVGAPFAHTSKSRLKAIIELAEKQKPDTDDIVTLSIKVNRKHWDRFMKLPEPVRQAYLERVVDDTVEEIFKDPKMLGYYMNEYTKEKGDLKSLA
ncbi:hypothetical protein Ngar_c17070 [Candidatus Nitrososphaera gargensis Ga9.2]|uniref:Uncharacterized protein n=1 Tax=Nitrososphaera gargensis (strain Ga9.2) TaxID=1237085 RepID=K0IFP7_NITGG|nr:hypothetical protein [Candidatus Nitrososphaera gargensis]AFU58640.1 hypothetical protein Ngar_c17070 [Candidatus Nitrososphaera gargensis Ga9.2]